MLAVSAAGSDSMPVCEPLPNEKPLEAYAHIDANGILKRSSYDKSGTSIREAGIMAALATLRKEGQTSS
jgi:hypothetical protein